MEVNCLSKGKGFYFPPCHIVRVEGLTVLVDCPLDLSALKIFSPLPAVFNKSEDKSSSDDPCLIFEEPWYKAVTYLQLWDPCLIDIVLISSTMGLLGLPFLTRVKGFSAKVYVTEATARIGKLMMDDLVSMHAEFRGFYGIKDCEVPRWMKWDALDSLPSSLKEVACGEDCAELGGWMPLYSAMDVKECMLKLHTLKYSEESTYNGILVIKAFSSGSEIGACNWGLTGPHGAVACISCSTIASACAMEFDHRIFEKRDVVIISDFSCESGEEDASIEHDAPREGELSCEEQIKHLTDSEAEEKLAFVCACCVDTIKVGGSVLLPLCRIGTMLRLMQLMSDVLQSYGTKAPIYFVSSVAEEVVAAANVMPEWLSQNQQEKMFSGELFLANAEGSKEMRFYVFPAAHSPELLTNWQQPCIIFCSHYTLRLGPGVHFLQLFSKDSNSLLVLEDGVDADLSLMPFKPIKMRILKCNFSSSMSVQRAKSLLTHFQPRHIVLPDDLKQQNVASNFTSISYYAEGETVKIPSLKPGLNMEIVSDLITSLKWSKLREDDTIRIARMNGQVSVDSGVVVLLAGDNVQCSETMPTLYWGKPDIENLLARLADKGIRGSVERSQTESDLQCFCVMHIHEPDEVVIRIEDTITTISTSNVHLAASINEIMISVLNCI